MRKGIKLTRNPPVLEPDLNRPYLHIDLLRYPVADGRSRSRIIVEFRFQSFYLVLRHTLPLLSIGACPRWSSTERAGWEICEGAFRLGASPAVGRGCSDNGWRTCERWACGSGGEIGAVLIRRGRGGWTLGYLFHFHSPSCSVVALGVPKQKG